MGCDSVASGDAIPGWPCAGLGLGWQQGWAEEWGTLLCEAKSERVKAREPRASGGNQGGLWVVKRAAEPQGGASRWASGEHFALVWMEWCWGWSRLELLGVLGP